MVGKVFLSPSELANANYAFAFRNLLQFDLVLDSFPLLVKGGRTFYFARPDAQSASRERRRIDAASPEKDLLNYQEEIKPLVVALPTVEFRADTLDSYERSLSEYDEDPRHIAGYSRLLDSHIHWVLSPIDRPKKGLYDALDSFVALQPNRRFLIQAKMDDSVDRIDLKDEDAKLTLEKIREEFGSTFPQLNQNLMRKLGGNLSLVEKVGRAERACVRSENGLDEKGCNLDFLRKIFKVPDLGYKFAKMRAVTLPVRFQLFRLEWESGTPVIEWNQFVARYVGGRKDFENPVVRDLNVAALDLLRISESELVRPIKFLELGVVSEIDHALGRFYSHVRLCPSRNMGVASFLDTRDILQTVFREPSSAVNGTTLKLSFQKTLNVRIFGTNPLSILFEPRFWTSSRMRHQTSPEAYLKASRKRREAVDAIPDYPTGDVEERFLGSFDELLGEDDSQKPVMLPTALKVGKSIFPLRRTARISTKNEMVRTQVFWSTNLEVLSHRLVDKLEASDDDGIENAYLGQDCVQTASFPGPTVEAALAEAYDSTLLDTVPVPLAFPRSSTLELSKLGLTDVEMRYGVSLLGMMAVLLACGLSCLFCAFCKTLYAKKYLWRERRKNLATFQDEKIRQRQKESDFPRRDSSSCTWKSSSSVTSRSVSYSDTSFQ